MHTELRIDGANCPDCLNATLDALRSVPGVDHVATQSSAGCVAIEHQDVGVEVLLDETRAHLRGIDQAGAELVMVSVEPVVVNLACPHH